MDETIEHYLEKNNKGYSGHNIDLEDDKEEIPEKVKDYGLNSEEIIREPVNRVFPEIAGKNFKVNI